METSLTSSDVARRFGDILAEIKHSGRPILITRHGHPVARISPVEAPASALTLAAFLEHFPPSTAPNDPTFADDIEVANSADQHARDPWES